MDLNRKFRNAIGKPPEDGDQRRRKRTRRFVVATKISDLIKITATAGVLSPSSADNAQFSDEELQALISTAKDYGFRVAAHAHGNEGIKRACAGVDLLNMVPTWMMRRSHKTKGVLGMSRRFQLENSSPTKPRLKTIIHHWCSQKRRPLDPRIQSTLPELYSRCQDCFRRY